MNKYSTEVELAAVQFMVIALIASHPDKKLLLETFDRLSSEHQVAALAVGGKGIPPAYRESLSRWRKQIEQNS